MNKVLAFTGKHKAPENQQHFSYVETRFDDQYERHVRELTRDVNPAKEANNLPADRLVYAFITVNRTTGVATEFGWASGRKDAYIIVDKAYDEVSSEVIEERGATIEKLQEKFYDRGFKHEEYDGGFKEFAQNFERATGRICPPAIVVLCDGQLRAVA